MSPKLRKILPWTATAVGLVLLATASVIAQEPAWKWSNLSDLLVRRDGTMITTVSARKDDFLATDGSRLYRFRENAITDLTEEARHQGFLSIADMASDGRAWLISSRGDKDDQSVMSLYDGNAWTAISGLFPFTSNGVEAVGKNSVWYVRTYGRDTGTDPLRYQFYRWDGINRQPETMVIPEDLVSAHKPGCFTYPNANKLCTGASRVAFVNETAYFIGGLSEFRGTNDTIYQTAKSNIWKLNGTAFEPILSTPNFKFISGIWQLNNQIVIATSDAVSDPFAANKLWRFDGKTVKDISGPAYRVGLLPFNARETRMAQGGDTAMILTGKKAFRLVFAENNAYETLTNMGRTRDLFVAVAGNASGFFLLGGAVSESQRDTAFTPLTAKLASVVSRPSAETDLNTLTADTTNVPAYITQPITSYPLLLNAVIVPAEDLVARGTVQTYSLAFQQTKDGMDRAEIFLNGRLYHACLYNSVAMSQVLCRFEINTTTFEPGSVITVVTRLVDGQGRTEWRWIKTTRLLRSASAEPGVANKTNNLTAWAWLAPNVDEISTNDERTSDDDQSTTFTIGAWSQNITRLDILVDGTVTETCQFPARPTTRECSYTVKPADFAHNHTIAITGRAMDASGSMAWTEPRYVRVRHGWNAPDLPAASVSITTDKPNGYHAGETVMLMARGWTPRTFERLDIYANGQHAATCTTEICQATLKEVRSSAIEYQARVTDLTGSQTWTGVYAIRVK